MRSASASASTATASTILDHGYVTNDYVTLAGAVPSGYNGRFKITVTGAKTFTFTVSSGLTTPASGAITVTYLSDAQGGRRATFETYATVWAERMTLRAGERLQLAAVQSEVTYRFRIRTRGDVSPKHRAVWQPRWPPNATSVLLEILGVLPDDDGRTYQLLECAGSSAR